PPVVGNGMVYGINVEKGRMYAFDEHCRPAPDALCRPAWSRGFYAHPDPPFDPTAHEVEGEMTPVVSGGQVFAGDWGTAGSGMLHVFDASTGHPASTSVWTNDGTPFYLDRPVVDGDKVFWAAGQDAVYAYPIPCVGVGWNEPANSAHHR